MLNVAPQKERIPDHLRAMAEQDDKSAALGQDRRTVATPRLRTLHPVCRPQPIQPSNGRFYSLQPPPPGPATPGGSLAARGRPQCRPGPRAPAHPGGGGGGAQEQV